MASDVHRASGPSLLRPVDPSPVIISNAAGSSPFLLIGDHAGNLIPSALGDLGLSAADRIRHIAWDIGVAGLGEALAARLDAMFVRQTYSRLVVDCNRGPHAPDASPAVSDRSPVPGNRDLGEAARGMRFAEIHEPYHQAITDELDRRFAEGRPVMLIALHSFTPALSGQAQRPWQVGVLHDGGRTDLSHGLLREFRRDDTLCVGDNAPYAMNGIDYTVPRHAYPRAIPYAELEIRQDLIAHAEGQAEWADRIEAALVAAAKHLD